LTSGTIAANQALFGVNVQPGTVIVSGSGTTWTLNQSNTVATAENMSSADVAGYMTASISGTTLTVTSINPGATIYLGQTVVGSGVTANTVITALGSGAVLSAAIATAGTGYALNDTITVLGGVYGNSPATFTVTAIGASGAVTTLVQTYAGQYTSLPISPVATSTSGSGSGLTLNLTTGTGTGQTGTYVVSNSQTVGSETMYILNWSILPVNDGAFQGGTIVDIVDNYFVYNDPNTQKWAASNVLSSITYGLSYASKFTGPDNLVSLVCDHGQVYLLGEKTSEVWADTGTFPFAFQRIPGSSSEHGISAPFSVSRVGNSFAYLAKNNRGQAEIVMMNGYFPQRISTHAVENTLVDQYINDAVAYTYQLEGHEVYVISFPTLDLTWAYDFTTQMWHKWLWVDSNNVYHRHRSNCSAFFQGVVLVGDWQNGLIYQLDPTNYTDNGSLIRRLRRAPHLVTDLQRQYFAEMQIQFQPGVGLSGKPSQALIPNATYYQSPLIINTSLTVDPGKIIVVSPSTSQATNTGVDPQAMLRWSSNGGSTWSNEHWTSIGKIGRYNNRAIWRRLGWSRDRIFEVVVTDPIKAVIVSANLKAEEGEN
jgi:hypothetical protein